MSNLSLRGLDPDTVLELKALARKENASVNTLVLRLIRQGLGHGELPRPQRRSYDDLDALAGSWSDDDAAIFHDATAAFSKVDTSLWK